MSVRTSARGLRCLAQASSLATSRPRLVECSLRRNAHSQSRRLATATTAPRPTPTATPAAAPKPTTASTRSPVPQNIVNTTTSNPLRATQDEPEPFRSLTEGLADPPPVLSDAERQVDWTRSFHGLSSEPFTDEQNAVLTAELSPDDIEIKPDGIIYLPEIKYRRILNKAFKAGGWGLAPRGQTIVTDKLVTREYALVAGGRLISIARGEMQYFDADGIPTATEGCKSNALMRCCKDLGIASELWDPRFIRKFMAEHGRETIVEHVMTKKRRKHYLRKDDTVRYPFKEVGPPPGSTR